MGDLLTAHAANQPDKTAVIDDRTGGDVRTLTYAELEARANQLVWALVDLGVRPGDKIVWCGQNSTGIVEVMNAARKIGAGEIEVGDRLAVKPDAPLSDVAAGLRARHAELLGQQVQRIRHQQIGPLRDEHLEHGRGGGACCDIAEHGQRGLQAVQVGVAIGCARDGSRLCERGRRAKHKCREQGAH